MLPGGQSFFGGTIGNDVRFGVGFEGDHRKEGPGFPTPTSNTGLLRKIVKLWF